jgi:hypothetical protein
MQDTLKAKLERLHQLEAFGNEFNFDLAEGKLRDAEVKVLRKFYAEDSLAYDVARGSDSYRTRIEPIEAKYGSFWRRMWVPRKDESFDEEVRRVLGSMNGVGESYARPEQFTTDEREEYGLLDKLPLAISGGVALFMGLLTYYLPESSGEVNEYVEALVKSSPAITFAIPYGMLKTTRGVSIGDGLQNLTEKAQKTDEFLRQHYV